MLWFLVYLLLLIAQALSLSGTHFCIDAACSSSFYAIKLASHYLWSGKADLMLAGAISCSDPLFLQNVIFWYSRISRKWY